MFEFELDRKKAELRCQNATRIADELESHSSSALMRSPDNPYLTRAVAYNLYLSASRDRPILVNPHEFAIQLLFVHRGLYGGVEAALAGNNKSFYVAFFGVEEHMWPLMCRWEHTWHIIGQEAWYSGLVFEPTRQDCLMEDSRITGTRVRCSKINVTTSASIACDPGKVESQGVLDRMIKRNEVFHYQSFLPSGHNASIQLRITSTSSHVDYDVDIFIDEGREGIGANKWKSARETSPAKILAMVLNKDAKIIKAVRKEPDQKSPIDVWIQLELEASEVPIQVTTIEPPEVYASLASGTKAKLSIDKTALLAMVKCAFVRKHLQSASGIHLLLDCGFLIPSSDAFEADVRKIFEEVTVIYDSIWLVSRIDHRASCVYGSSPF